MDKLEAAFAKRNLERSIQYAALDMLTALQTIDGLMRLEYVSKEAILAITRPAIHKALHGKCVVEAPVVEPDTYEDVLELEQALADRE